MQMCMCVYMDMCVCVCMCVYANVCVCEHVCKVASGVLDLASCTSWIILPTSLRS